MPSQAPANQPVYAWGPSMAIIPQNDQSVSHCRTFIPTCSLASFRALLNLESKIQGPGPFSSHSEKQLDQAHVANEIPRGPLPSAPRRTPSTPPQPKRPTDRRTPHGRYCTN